MYGGASMLGFSRRDRTFTYQEAHRLEINGTRGRVVVEDTVRRFCFQEAGSETAEIWQAGYFNEFDLANFIVPSISTSTLY